jgi:uncharacterized protein YdaU (DUF1376 family)
VDKFCCVRQILQKGHAMKRPWMSFWVAEYLADTTHLTAQQHGAYLLLILRYWATGSIPHDDAQLAQITRLELPVWLREKAIVLAFFRSDLTHKRIEEELTKASAISRKRSVTAKRRHRANLRQGTDPPIKSDHANAVHLHGHSQSQSQERVGVGSVRARGPLISQDALDFATELARIAGHDPDFLPPRWVSDGPAYRIQMMLDAGYQIGTMRDAAKSVMDRRRKAGGDLPVTIRFFDRIFARAHAPQLPLPVAQVVKTEGQNGEAINRGSGGNWQSRRDAQHDARAALRAFVEGAAPDSGGQGGGSPLRVVSDA